MGFKIAWVAVRGKSPDAVVGDLALARTGEYEECAEAEYSIVTMPSGWVMVVNCFRAGDLVLEKPLERVKAHAEVLTCYVDETTMRSELSFFRDGSEVWSVTHDCENGQDDLQIVGTPPAPFAAIRDDLAAQRDAASNDDVDYFFDIAVELGAALTGFRHDADIAGQGATPFELLEPIRNPPPKARIFDLFRRK